MSVEFLLEAVFIFTFVFSIETKESVKFVNESEISSTLDTTTTGFNTVEAEELLTKDNRSNILQQPDNVKTWNQTQAPLFLNLIINLNFLNDDKKSNKLKKSHGRTKRENKETKRTTTEETTPERSKRAVSENLGSIFEKIKLRMELQRKKKNIEYQNSGETKLALQNGTNDRSNKIQDILTEKFPQMSLLNEDKELDVSKWLKNWKDILAVSPILSTEKPTKPEVDFIDEWRYAYRVTLYNSDVYNTSNFACSGLLVSAQWVLTSVFCSLGDDATLLIGVHSLPGNISDHNKYGVLKKVYSLNDNLELIQMDRPVQWAFNAPDIRAVKMAEMENLLRRGKCSLLSWIPVDIEKGVFELRQYPQLTLQSDSSSDKINQKKNSLKASAVHQYGWSKKDVGSPVLCDGVVTGIVLDVDDEEDVVVEMLCPVLEWITFFTREGSYFEVTARKFTLRSAAVGVGTLRGLWGVYLWVVWSVLVSG